MTDLYKDCHKAGGMSRYAWCDDPKRLAFTAARYKHVAKMLEGWGSVLEVGCADGYFSRIVRQHVGALTAIDTDKQAIQEARAFNYSERWPIQFDVGYVEEYEGAFDAVYALDVLEHVDPGEAERRFLLSMRTSALVAIIGTPSLESQEHASRLSRMGHVNCYSGEELRARLLEFWDHVFMFTMHDETLGTSFLPMAQYLLALCVRDKS